MQSIVAVMKGKKKVRRACPVYLDTGWCWLVMVIRVSRRGSSRDPGRTVCMILARQGTCKLYEGTMDFSGCRLLAAGRMGAVPPRIDY